MKKKLLTTVLVAATAVSLTACVSDMTVSDTAAQSTATGATVTETQVTDIVSEVNTVVQAADAEMNASALESRVSDPALSLRRAQYSVATARSTTVSPLNLTPDYATASNNTQWPRAILVAAQNTNSTPTLSLLVQNDARSQYRLYSFVNMLGSVSLTIPAISEGANFLTGDATGFAMTPNEAAAAYAQMVAAGENGNDTFAADEFTLQWMNTVSSANSAVSTAGNVTMSAAQTSDDVVGLQSDDGNAVAFATYTMTLRYTHTEANTNLRLGSTAALVAEKTDVPGTADVTYLVTVALLIPPEGSTNQVSVLAADQSIQSVTFDDSATP